MISTKKELLNRMKKQEKLECFLDGNALCIVEKNFANLQESEAVFLPLTNEQRKDILKIAKEGIGIGTERKEG